MSDFIRKIASRKLWLAIAGVTTGIALILGVDGSSITDVSGALVSLASAITYIITEGKIDAERVKSSVINVVNAIEGADDNADSK